ncbi:hypothetical protein EQM14_11500 [Caproiciproducens sp. NJN-50]|uniref:hypothetical protein n=1 Tax=Acutalibacteraceae TaxID=3082771 RepID=UPI000FFE08DF|nr:MULTISPECIES: hypothetical protein [Acutalibacteraceae]QAT50335.1 hypothetical protein EQM14_11500 [Caproiciproducens sp. NJN-50]
MSNDKKEKTGIWMPPDMVKQIDAVFPLYECSSRSDFVCRAVKFYLGFLQTKNSTEYIHKTTLTFLEDQFAKLEARICRQLFRMCVELAMVSHITACQFNLDDEGLKKLRKKCVKDVKCTIGNIRFDNIYSYQHEGLNPEEDADESEN